MKKILFLILCCIGCLHNPDAPPANYKVDDVWCYHQSQDGHWQVQGFARQCPANTEYKP